MRANRTILVRTLFLLTLFGVAAFVPLLVRLWQIQIRDYDKYQEWRWSSRPPTARWRPTGAPSTTEAGRLWP